MPNKRGETPKDPATAEVLVRVGARIRAVRVAAGLTQERAADAAGIDSKRYQRLERGEVNATINTIARVASALGTTFWQLTAPEK